MHRREILAPRDMRRRLRSGGGIFASLLMTLTVLGCSISEQDQFRQEIFDLLPDPATHDRTVLDLSLLLEGQPTSFWLVCAGADADQVRLVPRVEGDDSPDYTLFTDVLLAVDGGQVVAWTTLDIEQPLQLCRETIESDGVFGPIIGEHLALELASVREWDDDEYFLTPPAPYWLLIPATSELVDGG